MFINYYGISETCAKSQYSVLTALAGEWRPCTSGGRLRFAHAITFFVASQGQLFSKKNQKETPTTDIGKIFCPGGKSLAISPSYPHANTIAFPGDQNLLYTHN